MTATGTKWLRATVGRDDIWSVPEKRSLLRCRVQEKHGSLTRALRLSSCQISTALILSLSKHLWNLSRHDFN
jgi:hypothetical protein